MSALRHDAERMARPTRPAQRLRCGAAVDAAARKYLVGAICVAHLRGHAAAAGRLGPGLAQDRPTEAAARAADLLPARASASTATASSGTIRPACRPISSTASAPRSSPSLFCLGLTIPAGYALARFPIPARKCSSSSCCSALIIPYQALLTPLFLMFAQLKLHNSLVGLAIVHTAIQLPFSLYIMRNAFEAVPRELEEAAVIDGCNSWQVLIAHLPAGDRAGDRHGRAVRLHHLVERVPGGAGDHEQRIDAFTLPLILAAARQQTSIGGTDWGMLQAGVTISIIPCIASTCSCRNTTSPASSAAR